MKKEELDRYFERIGYSGSREPTLETLKALQAAQLYSIPFETFDNALGYEIVLSWQNVFDKLVTDKRGGGCYEVNSLLFFALRAIGFNCYLAHAKLCDAEDSVHMVVIVDVGGVQWVADVGWGNGFVEPVLITSEVLKKLYTFTLDPKPLEFFQPRVRYHQTCYTSLFANDFSCCLPTKDGYKSIEGTRFIHKIGRRKEIQEIQTTVDYRKILLKEFGLNIPISRPVSVKGGGMLLQTPRNKADWDAYHHIRFTQIHRRYCPTWIYNPHDTEEQEAHRTPFVLKKEGSPSVLGVIRVDMLASSEASFRWIAIHPDHVRQGLGTHMLQLAEQFVRDHGRNAIRIPATAESLPFANRLGFTEEPWTDMPQEECMIAVRKIL